MAPEDIDSSFMWWLYGTVIAIAGTFLFGKWLRRLKIPPPPLSSSSPSSSSSTKLPKDYYFQAEKPRRFVITGSGSGVGRHLTGVFLKQGHRVLATDVNMEALLAAAKDDQWESMSTTSSSDDDNGGGDDDRNAAKFLELQKVDVRVPEDWARIEQWTQQNWGGIDVLLNIAGYLKPGRAAYENLPPHIALHMDVNVRGVANGTQVFAQQMKKNAHGTHGNANHIINFGSLSSLAPIPGISLYSASKHACRTFSLCAARDLRKHGISVTVVLPDAIATPMVDLQSHDQDAATTFSAGMLTIQDIEKVLVEDVLLNRQQERVITDRWLPRLLCAVCDTFHEARFLQLIYKMMAEKGSKHQQAYKKSKLA